MRLHLDMGYTVMYVPTTSVKLDFSKLELSKLHTRVDQLQLAHRVILCSKVILRPFTTMTVSVVMKIVFQTFKLLQISKFMCSISNYYLPLTSTSKVCPSLIQCTPGSGTPLGAEHSSKAGSPLATFKSRGSVLNSSRRTKTIPQMQHQHSFGYLLQLN